MAKEEQNTSQINALLVKYSDGKAKIDTPFARDTAFYLEDAHTLDGSPVNGQEDYQLTLTVDGAMSWLGVALKIAKALDGNAFKNELEKQRGTKFVGRLEVRQIVAKAGLAIAGWIDDENRDIGDKSILDQIHLLRIIDKLIESIEKLRLADKASQVFLDLVVSYSIDLGSHNKTVELAAVETKLEAERARNRDLAEQKSQKAQEENARIDAEGEKFCREWKSRNRYPAKGRETSHHPSKQEVMEGIAAALNSQGFDLVADKDSKLGRVISIEKIRTWCGLKPKSKNPTCA